MRSIPFVQISILALGVCVIPSSAQNTFPLSGSAGIGVEAPSHTLHLRTPSPWIRFDKVNGQESGLYFTTEGTGRFYIYTDNDGSEALKIQSAGGVAGEHDALPRIQIPFSNANIYLAQSGGYVGIGAPPPTAKFTVYQTGGAWADGIRLNLAGKNWDFVSDSNGDRLIIAKNQSIGEGLLIHNGNVGIGTEQADHKLTVNGKIKAEEVKVVVDVPADYVFDGRYNLLPLSDLEQYIHDQKHLPGIPNAKTISAEGWNVGEMSNKLLEKVEELTLYLIEMKKENEALKKRVSELELKSDKNK